MKIAILGTGSVGKTLAAGFTALGKQVVVGTRDPQATQVRDDWDVDFTLATYADAAADADLVVSAVSGAGALEALAAAGDLSGKVVLDVSNPLDFSRGFPPTLSVKDTDSLAEKIQRAHPDARVVKGPNMVTAALMVAPRSLADGDHTIFIAGDDPEARQVVRGLLEEAGWTDVVEFAALEAARGMEMWLPLWLRIMQQVGHPNFNIKLVRS